MAVIRRLQWRLAHRLRAWGAGRVLGMVMLLAAAGLYAYTYQVVEKSYATAARKVLQLQASPHTVAARDQGASNDLNLPAQVEALAGLRHLHRIADENGLLIDSAQYRLEKDGRLSRYRLTLPVVGTYPDIRAFLSQAMQQFPHLALEDIRISREEPGMAEVDVVMQLSFYFRP